MDLLTVAVPVGSEVDTVYAVEYAGTLWLVPIWGDQPDGELTMPARLVCMSLLPHEKTPGLPHDYILQAPLPIEIFDYEAPIPEQSGLIVVDPMRLQMPRERREN